MVVHLLVWIIKCTNVKIIFIPHNPSELRRVSNYLDHLQGFTWHFYKIYATVIKYIQGDSEGICNTLGNDSMCDSKQKRLYQHVSNFRRLRSYGHFLIPVYALMWTAVAYRVRCQLTRPPSYRQSSVHISTLGRYLRNKGKVGWVGIRLATSS
jgi:hypothetical protein